LADLGRADAWVLATTHARHGQFLIEVVRTLHAMAVFPAASDVLVNWLVLDRNDSPDLQTLRLPGVDRDASRGRPFAHLSLTGTAWYDGRTTFAVGGLDESQGTDAHVVRASAALTPSVVFDMIAQAAREARARQGFPAAAPGVDGQALRGALVRHLADRPEQAAWMSATFPLTGRYRAPDPTEEQVRATQVAYRKGLQGRVTASDYRVPAEVVRALRGSTEQWARLDHVEDRRQIGAALGVNRSALRLLRGYRQGPTMHAWQCAHPDRVREPSARELRRLAAQADTGVSRVHWLFNRGLSIASALRAGLIDARTVENALYPRDRRWSPDEG
ncbi:hypothetical protein, partial [Mitsuaria sp. GD03876]|uniref:hypothetical protein n=1 Tax=Mitsuaria sp. GD03876 TaxID=2975399 RepID=UPI002446A011